MSIPFTQFIRPSGRPQPVTVDRPAEIEAMAQELIEAGYRFEIEVLTTGHINMDCVRPGADEPLAGELSRNGPEVLEAVDRMVTAAHTTWRATQ